MPTPGNTPPSTADAEGGGAPEAHRVHYAARVAELLAEYDRPDASAADLLCDRHDPAATAFTVVEPSEGRLRRTDLTFGQLRERSSRFAAALRNLGIGPGDAVGALMGKSADLAVALLGCWRAGATVVPLFTAFAPPAIAMRLRGSNAKLVIADPDQAGKLAPGADMPADAPWRTITAGGPESQFGRLIAESAPDGDAAAVGGSGRLVALFTSGTTGTPKAVPVPVKALAGFSAYLEFGLDVAAEDVYWCAADPGWAYGLYYGILAPLARGQRSILLAGRFSVDATWQVLAELGVTNFAAAPTVYRSLRAGKGGVPAGVRLRRASSAGEPLTPEVIAWARERLGLPVRDHYGQTEHGMFIGNAWADGLRRELRPGSMGRPLPGWSCAVLRNDEDAPAPAGESGRIAINVAESPLFWFPGYEGAPEQTAARFTEDGAWYLTGDAGKADADGDFFFAGRDDDVVIMAGYRIGPFDIESVLAGHEAVIEAAVVGKPDGRLGEQLEAYAVLREGAVGGPRLEAELQRLVKTRFAAHAYPRVVHFVEELPKTPSGKIQRYLLRRALAGEG